MPSYRDASSVTPSRLGPRTPLGLFRTTERGASIQEFWVVEYEGEKHAIVLRGDDPRWIFEAFKLEETDGWPGISLGPVEVQVDLEACEFADEPRFGKGSITICAGETYITAVPKGKLGQRISFKVESGGVISGEAAAGLFGRWRLIQRDHANKPIVLYEFE